MFSSWKLGYQIAVLPSVAIVLMAAVVFGGLADSTRARLALEAEAAVISQKMRQAINFRGSVHDRAIELRDVVAASAVGNTAVSNTATETIAALAADYAAASTALSALMEAHGRADGTAVLTRIQAVEAETLPMIAEVTRLAAAGETEAANKILLTDGRDKFTRWLGTVNEFIDLKEAEASAIAEKGDAAFWRRVMFVVVGLLGAVLISALLSLNVTRAITRSVAGLIGPMEELADDKQGVTVPSIDGKNEFARVSVALQTLRDAIDMRHSERAEAEVQALAVARRRSELETLFASMSFVIGRAMEGDLSERVKVDTSESDLAGLAAEMNQLIERLDSTLSGTADVVAAVSHGRLDRSVPVDQSGIFLELAESVNGTISRLSETIQKVGATSASIESEVGLISSNATTVSEGSAKQASTLQENSATMEEITSTVKSNAANAENALVLAHEASDRANRGGEIVGETASAMQRINDSSARISDIVSVIDAIAFQTNLLALNAAVEAARAGESGKGFAVVASEVRTLAQRSSESARDIRELIDSSSAYVADGVRLVAATGDALTEIVTSITSVSSTVGEITEASKEQARGVEEISNSIANLDAITQENAVIASTNASSARQLKDRSRTLQDLLGFFSTGQVVHQSEQDADAAWEKLATSKAETPLLAPPALDMAPVSEGRAAAPAQGPASIPLPLAENDDESWAEF
ncbi:MAG: methyl-accepting chemotaxis protein [Pseudomonadota bacterium]